MLLRPHEIFLKNLRQQIDPDSRAYCTREEAYEELKHVTGQDFGYDADAWEGWVLSHLEVFKRPPPPRR